MQEGMGRHTRWMRRGVVVVLVAGTAAGGFALTAAGREKPAAPPPQAPRVQEPAAAANTELPPLPKMRPKVVEPVAGDAEGSATAAEADPGLTDVGPKPDRAASAGARPRTAPGTTDITKANALPNGVALPPLEAPEEVKRIIEAGNIIARSPYVWGGGHGKWLDRGYDCSGSVSFALAAAGLLDGPLASGPLMSWGKPGPGRWVTIYSSPGHVFMIVAGVRFDTSNSRVTGSRWGNEMRSTSGFVARHPAGL
jgi:cell wall-associated NlpC family hydrolase